MGIDKLLIEETTPKNGLECENVDHSIDTFIVNSSDTQYPPFDFERNISSYDYSKTNAPSRDFNV